MWNVKLVHIVDTLIEQVYHARTEEVVALVQKLATHYEEKYDDGVFAWSVAEKLTDLIATLRPKISNDN